MTLSERKYVTRSGLKLEKALESFEIDPAGKVCIDLGCNVGGFTDCLLRGGAKKIYSVDTGYGVLDYNLRKNPRVVVMERTNALYMQIPELGDIVTIDLGWTRQKMILPKAKEFLRQGGQIISLVKPHYESPPKLLKGGVLEPESAEKVFQSVLNDIPKWGLQVQNQVKSPIVGKAGNVEYLVCLTPSN